MSKEDVLRVLDDASNQNIDWALGDLLRARLARDSWQQSPILQHLEANDQRLQIWNKLISQTREALADEEDLPQKAKVLLKPEQATFDASLEDFIAEMLAVLYLSELGHKNIRFLSEDDSIKTDLLSVYDGHNYVTEAKNLHEPNNLSYVAFRHWNYKRCAHPDEFNFTVNLLSVDDPFEDLTSEQASAIRALIDGLPNRKRPAIFNVTLPGNRSMRIRIADGIAGMMRLGPGPFSVGPVVAECKRSLFVKLLDHARKALTQLYSKAVPPEYRRLLFVRWRPPEDIWSIGEADGVRASVSGTLQHCICEFFPHFSIAILYTGEDPRDTPKATWQ